MPTNEILRDCREKMTKAVEFFHDELRHIRTGRASAALVEHIKVDYYGAMTDLRELASIAVPQPDVIVIKPFDPSSVKAIEKAIQTSDLGITPNTAGNVIRLPIPPLSVERRKQLTMQIKKMAEQARIAVRNIRRDANKVVDKEKNEGTLTEDEAHKSKEQIQEITDEFNQKIDEMLQIKIKEVMEE